MRFLLLLVDVPTPNVVGRVIVIHRNVPLATDVFLIRRRLAPRSLPNMYVDLFDHVDETRPSRTGKVGTVLGHFVHDVRFMAVVYRHLTIVSQISNHQHLRTRHTDR